MRRRALRLAEQLELDYMAAAAAQGGKRAFRALHTVARRLRKEAGLVQRTDPEEIVRALGLTDRRGEAK